MVNARRYCFTLNNYTTDEVASIEAIECKYLVYGREVGESNTPHLQGFLIYEHPKTFASVKRDLGDRCHIEAARGTSKQAIDYCKKDGQVFEKGDPPNSQGKRSDWEAYKDWILEIGSMPSRHEMLTTFPSLYARYPRACQNYAEAIAPSPVLVDSEPRFGWQANLAAKVETDPHPREINFFVDEAGNSGKTWMCQYFITKYPLRVQVLSIGKRDDLAFAIDIDKDIFVFDVPRTQMMYLQYSVLEKLKDRMIFSPKYESSFKILRSVPHVIVFSNEQPDMNTLSIDRYKVITI